MKSILLLPAYFHPEVVASSYLSHSSYGSFAKHGYHMVVYTPMPTRGISSQIRSEYRKKRHETMYDGQMDVYRFSLLKEGNNPIFRAIRYLVGCVKQLWFGVFSKKAKICKVMFISSTPPIQGAMAALVKKWRKIPFVYNLQDIFPDSLVGAGLTHYGSLLWKIGRRVENFTYRNADKIIVISEDFKRNIMAKGVPEGKIEVIYNWVDEKSVVPIASEDNFLFDELSLSRDDFHVVYAGNFGNAQNIEVILKAAKILDHYPDIKFDLFGTGGLKDHFVDMSQQENLANVIFSPLQPLERVSYVYSLGDVGIVSCKKGLGKGAMPSKTWSILSAGTPVIASYDSGTDLERILTYNQLGLLVEADDAEALANAILQMYNNRAMCQEMGKRGRKFIENNLTKEVGTTKLVDIIKSFE